MAPFFWLCWGGSARSLSQVGAEVAAVVVAVMLLIVVQSEVALPCASAGMVAHCHWALPLKNSSYDVRLSHPVKIRAASLTATQSGVRRLMELTPEGPEEVEGLPLTLDVAEEILLLQAARVAGAADAKMMLLVEEEWVAEESMAGMLLLTVLKVEVGVVPLMVAGM